MMKHLARIASAALILGIASLGWADIKPAALINPNMVLQRGKPGPIWGTADPGEVVTVRFAEQEKTATADAQGHWRIDLDAMEASREPRTLVIEGRNRVEIGHVLVGEVWLCAGQSNMAMHLSAAEKPSPGAAEGDLSQIRVANVRRGLDREPRAVSLHRFGWRRADSGDPGEFSAVAFYFAQRLQRELDVPVGVIVSAWGGTPIEPWLSRQAIEGNPELSEVAERMAESDAEYARVVQQHQAASAAAKPGEEPPPLRHNMRKHDPTAIYNAMIRPVVPYGIRGFVWYQGESNVMSPRPAAQYAPMLQTLITSWRQDFGGGDLPFAVVQITPYHYKDPAQLFDLWLAQAAALKLPNTGLIVTNDIAPFDELHPPNKHAIGDRAVLWALANVYGRKGVVFSGPIYKSHAIEGRQVRITFDHVGSGLAARDGQPLAAFSMAGADGKFVPATASIDGNSVVVQSDQVAQPVAVRYGWVQQDQMRLMNREGLPAPAFATGMP